MCNITNHLAQMLNIVFSMTTKRTSPEVSCRGCGVPGCGCKRLTESEVWHACPMPVQCRDGPRSDGMDGEGTSDSRPSGWQYWRPCGMDVVLYYGTVLWNCAVMVSSPTCVVLWRSWSFM
jgi:hypothetical protein